MRRGTSNSGFGFVFHLSDFLWFCHPCKREGLWAVAAVSNAASVGKGGEEGKEEDVDTGGRKEQRGGPPNGL